MTRDEPRAAGEALAVASPGLAHLIMNTGDLDPMSPALDGVARL